MPYTLESVPCNICGSNNYHAVSSKGKNGLPTNVVLCKNCGLGYLNPRWNAESYMSFYRDEYDHHYRPKILKTETYNPSDTNHIEQRMRSLEHFPETINSILSVGSGEGKTLKHFSSLFPKSALYAIEPSAESQEQLKQFGISTISENVDNDWESAYIDSMDLIIMRHVLEHFMDPLSALKKIRKTLRDQGILYIAVPNNLNPSKNLEGNWFRNVHTYYFNKHSLENLMKLAGLEILSLVEGDQYNQREVYLFVKKAAHSEDPIISSKHFDKQLEVFTKKLRLDRRIDQRILRFLKRIR